MSTGRGAGLRALAEPLLPGSLSEPCWRARKLVPELLRRLPAERAECRERASDVLTWPGDPEGAAAILRLHLAGEIGA